MTALKANCYVCGTVIKAGAVYVGNGVYRHKRCKPLSRKWLGIVAGRSERSGSHKPGEVGSTPIPAPMPPILAKEQMALFKGITGDAESVTIRQRRIYQ